MSKINSHLHLSHPYRLSIEYGMPTYVPRTVSVLGAVMTGGSCGWAKDACRTAYGEYFERNQFMMNIAIAKRGTINSLCSPSLQQAFIKQINQIKQVQTDVEHVPLRFCQVEQFITQEKAYYPFAMISLLNTEKEEIMLIPQTDSCGCAAHNTKEMAIEKAMHEYLERQSLVGAFLSKQYRSTIAPELLMNLPRYAPLAQQFYNNGELYIFDIANGLPGYTIAIFYFAKSSKDKVQYTIGCAYNPNFNKALEGALSELWQDYSFIYESDAFRKYMKDIPGSSYNLNHLDDNCQSTRDKIPFALSQTNFDIESPAHVDDLPCYTQAELRKTMSSISEHVYVFHQHETARKLHIARIVSPDFFLHMSLEHPLNINNAYADHIGLDTNNTSRERIPFP